MFRLLKLKRSISRWALAIAAALALAAALAVCDPGGRVVCSQWRIERAANATVQNYDGVDDARWHGTVDEVLADIIEAFTPLVGGLMMNLDGTYNGSRFPDGSLNDGSVYS